MQRSPSSASPATRKRSESRSRSSSRSSAHRSRSEEHTSELQSRLHLVCRLLLEKKKKQYSSNISTSYKIIIDGNRITAPTSSSESSFPETTTQRGTTNQLRDSRYY